MPNIAADTSRTLIELGAMIIGLAALGRVASIWSLSAVPLYLIAGLAFGNGGLAPLHFTREFVRNGADLGVLLLLFMLGLEYSGEELKSNLTSGFTAGLVDFLLNFSPGLLAGLVLGWMPLPAVLLGGATYISSSGISARLLGELGGLGKTESGVIVSILVLEDLAMAVYLPVVAVLIAGGSASALFGSVAIAIAIVSTVLFVAVKFGRELSRFAEHQSDEVILFTVLGTILLVAGVAQHFHVSAAIGAFLVGIAVSGPIAEQSRRLIAPLRDLFSATFFFFFGLEIDPATLLTALPAAFALGAITAATKFATGYWVTRRAGTDKRGRLLSGTALIARGEFSIVIASLGAVIEPRLGTVTAAYVLLLATLGPIITRLVK